VDSKSNTARTPLSYAAEEGHEAVVKLLLENPVDMDSKSNTGRTPLSYAAENGHEAVTKLLLENPVDMDSKSNTGRTPLSYATENGHQALVTLLSSKNKVSMEAWSSSKHHVSDADTSFSSLLSITMA
jgi:ankyrin repeat protein